MPTPAQRDAVSDLLVAVLVSLIVGFLLVQAYDGPAAMEKCLRQFSQATCNHTLGG